MHTYIHIYIYTRQTGQQKYTHVRSHKRGNATDHHRQREPGKERENKTHVACSRDETKSRVRSVQSGLQKILSNRTVLGPPTTHTGFCFYVSLPAGWCLHSTHLSSRITREESFRPKGLAPGFTIGWARRGKGDKELSSTRLRPIIR